jgi:hypothetical protein
MIFDLKSNPRLDNSREKKKKKGFSRWHDLDLLIARLGTEHKSLAQTLIFFNPFSSMLLLLFYQFLSKI